MPRPIGNSGHRSTGAGGRSTGHRSTGTSSGRRAGAGGRSMGHRSAGAGRANTGGSGISPRLFRPRRRHTYVSYYSEPGYYAPRQRSHPFLSAVFIFLLLCLVVSLCVLVIVSRQPADKNSERIMQEDTGKEPEEKESEEKRSKIEEGICKLTDYYKDELGYLSEKCEPGLEYFYKKTNIQPVVLTMDIEKVSAYDDDEEINQLYSSLFLDEAHFLFVIFGNKEGTADWEYSYAAGSDAVSVMDDEAVDILFERIDHYYYDSNVSDDELVSRSFEDAADKIMK